MIIEGLTSWERSGRLRKVLRLAQQLDAICMEPLHPVRDGERIADMLASWTDEERRKLALLSGVISKAGKLPSAETWQALADFYRERARKVVAS